MLNYILTIISIVSFSICFASALLLLYLRHITKRENRSNEYENQEEIKRLQSIISGQQTTINIQKKRISWLQTHPVRIKCPKCGVIIKCV